MIDTTPRRLAPGPTAPHRIPLNVKSVRGNAPAFFESLRRKFGDTVRMPVGIFTVTFAFHPDGVKHVLQENNANYIRGVGYKAFKIFMGNGLLTTDGVDWRTRRRTVNPLFHRTAIDSMVTTMVDSTNEVMRRWEQPGGRAGDIIPEMMRITLGALGEIMFDTDLELEQEQVGVAMRVAIEAMVYRGTLPQLLPAWVPFPSHRRTEHARETMYAIVGRIIEAHRTGSHANRPDLVNMLLSATDDADQPTFTDDDIRDELMTIFMAGHETTGAGLAWALYELAHAPDVQRRLYEETERVLGGRDPVTADLTDLVYTKQVTEEVLRLHPPIWVYPRQAVAEDEVNGWHVPAGECVFMSPYVTQRHPDFWVTPLRFDPDRFTEAAQHGRPKYAYFPFGGGQRKCVGEAMALTQMHLTLAMIVSRFEIEPVANTSTDLAIAVSLRPVGGIALRLVPRKS
ncbi:cytochrome P450 [Nocardia sp. NPDC052566]|uniref:cytochrome P450 n=1 Tax=Nocardia sp. NPDC052566 TaxID=3364330 RepID=UPI0037C655CA